MFDEFKQSRIPFKKYSLESGYANTFKSETVKTVLSSTPAQDQGIFQSVERRGEETTNDKDQKYVDVESKGFINCRQLVHLYAQMVARFSYPKLERGSKCILVQV